ncbi:MAG: endonuclease/exonuclease/phosphatase family protein [Nitrospira sp.]|nr:endonuclease/exonuclease/phosphatase family protein [Nitrospira sp.]MDH4368520.1 endonuclease/exonuclease/phosphatase family protein [Nitrospira sp.]MDH5348019.1 endonuclease/exonuclease/phosphatase family protein [Nitrospira sp.]MDH5497021.1 endonuclease/exonuclease/phosphatase family protein [Nitrospira sp.]MDH5724162.1 endonuclease/exonuclease/phosphatase family protein [Nitrospira sp.]
MNRVFPILLWLAFTLLFWSPTAWAESGKEESSRLRVLTYNLLHDGAWSGFFENGTHLEERLDMSIQELQRLQPDVIALQEASDSRKHGNVPQRIAEALGYQMVFEPATQHISGIGFLDRLITSAIGFKEGPAILSRYPIVASEVYDLPRCQRRMDPRILLRAEISAPDGPIQVFSAHTAKGDECQLTRVGEVFREHRGTGRAILMGDLNTGEQSPVLTEWQKEPGLIDAFRVANPGISGGTVWQNIHVEWPTADRRVDFIFLLDGGTGDRPVVRSSRLAFDQPGRLPNGDALWPSDHRSVLADIELAPVDRPRISRLSDASPR